MEKKRDYDIGRVSCVIKKMIRGMKIFSLLLCLSLSSVFANSSAQVRLSLEMKEVALKEVFDEIMRLTDYKFVYSNNECERAGKISERER